MHTGHGQLGRFLTGDEIDRLERKFAALNDEDGHDHVIDIVCAVDEGQIAALIAMAREALKRQL